MYEIFLFVVIWTGACHDGHQTICPYQRKIRKFYPQRFFGSFFFQIFEGGIVSITYSYLLLNFELLIKLTVTCRCEFGSFYWKYPICFSPPIKLTSKLKYGWKWIQKFVHTYYFFCWHIQVHCMLKVDPLLRGHLL